MAGIATKKVGGDLAVQLTFPAVFEEAYLREGLRPAYDNPRLVIAEMPRSGNDLQDLYHEQKRIDAHRMAMAGVEARKAAEYRLLHSHANYYGLPPVVLSQRRFANPSMGAAGIGGDLYSARHQQDEGLRGGVLRTAQGQRFGFQKLKDRISQLDAIDAEKAAFTMGAIAEAQPEPIAVSQGIPEATGTKDLMELNAGLQELSAAIYSEDFSRLVARDTVKTAQMLFRLAPQLNREELEGVLTILDGLIENYESLDSTEDNRRDEPGYEYLNTVGNLIVAIREYTRQMLSAVERSPKDRLALSRNLVKTLNVARMGSKKGSPEMEYLASQSKGRYTDANEAQTNKEEKDRLTQVIRKLEKERTKASVERDAAKVAEITGRIGEAELRRRTASQMEEEARQRLTTARKAADALGLNYAKETPPSIVPVIPAYADYKMPKSARKRMERARIANLPGTLEAQRLANVEAERQMLESPAVRTEARRLARQSGVVGRLTRSKYAPFKEQAFQNITGRKFLGKGRARRSMKGGAVIGGASVEQTLEAQLPKGTTFDRDVRNQFGDRAGAYYGEQLPAPDGGLPARMPHRKPKDNTMPVAEAPQLAPVFSEMGAVPGATGKGRKMALKPKDPLKAKLGIKQPVVGGLTRATLPKDREGYCALAEKLRGSGVNIRVNSGSQLKNIRANFIKKLGL